VGTTTPPLPPFQASLLMLAGDRAPLWKKKKKKYGKQILNVLNGLEGLWVVWSAI